ncbi:MAG TPA: hypothetical protein ENH94_04395 [Phycisphaerales bacterium]|nr:hypothetical protein [Phycisphaerales bacterium]
MAVTDTSREAYDKVMANPDRDLAEVLAMIEELGPCHNNRILEALQQADKGRARKKRRGCAWVSNSCWPRVYDLMILKVVVDMGRYRGVWDGRNVSFNFRRVSGDDRGVPPGWEKVENKAKPSTNAIPNTTYTSRLKQAASTAGRTLQAFRNVKWEHKKVKGRKVPEPTKQLVFSW